MKGGLVVKKKIANPSRTGIVENLILRKPSLTEDVSGRFSDLRGNPGGSLIEGSCTRLIEYCSDIAESAIDIAMEQL